jgi:hypothetical protein
VYHEKREVFEREAGQCLIKYSPSLLLASNIHTLSVCRVPMCVCVGVYISMLR